MKEEMDNKSIVVSIKQEFNESRPVLLNLAPEVAQLLGYRNGAVLTQQQADEATHLNATYGLAACREAMEATDRRK